jgi:hypothetical protein
VQGITSRVWATLSPPPLIAVLIIHFSWRASFVITGIVSFAWVFAWLWFFRDFSARSQRPVGE